MPRRALSAHHSTGGRERGAPDRHAAPLPPRLQALLGKLLSHCAQRIEALLLTKRVDMFGALQFERDVRALTGRLGALSSRSVRGHTARLTQVTALLSLEREAELAELWADGGLRLSAAEARAILALRVEFKKEAIAAVKLPS